MLLLSQRAVKRISGHALDPVQLDIIFHLFGTEAGGDSLDPDRFAQACPPPAPPPSHARAHTAQRSDSGGDASRVS